MHRFRRCRFAWLAIVSAWLLTADERRAAAATDRPNILWLTSEDHGPQMGCYGDAFASTPNIDRLAARGVIYTHVWSNAPVCAPARTALISGMYPISLGAEHMRSMVRLPAGTAMYPQLLRQAGYYCTNNSKTDYNLVEPGKVWDESSAKAHWNNRKPGQPFFAAFNSMKSHESHIRKRPHKPVHDPARVRIPAYHPDTPESRQDWAQYYDCVSAVDADAGKHLEELQAAGLAEDTIVFYFADHGPGMPRSKRSPCNSGLQVPLVVFIPQKFQELRSPDYHSGGRSDRLVSFIDFAPTVLSLAGIEPPKWMHGRAFLGRFQAAPSQFLFGFRGRMDERIDFARSATDGRFVYVRNYMPHRIYGQHVAYMFETPTTRVWKALHDAGRLNAAQDAFWDVKPPEELYDLSVDRDEVHNLATLAEYQAALGKLRQAQQKFAADIHDLGFLPEGEIHRRSRGSSPYEMGHDAGRYPFARIFETAERASMLNPDVIPALKEAAHNNDSAVRYWAALGFLMRGRDAMHAGHRELFAALDDSSSDVRIAAGEALGLHGDENDRRAALHVLADCADWSKHDVFTAVSALNSIDALGENAAAISRVFRALPARGSSPSPRYAGNVSLLLNTLGKRFP